VRDRVRAALLSWYRAGHRDLPWRRSGDPYAIWISEIMLQQTRVETVKDYFARFMARFPTPTALAEAPLGDVLELWSGLGYYARARNLHAAAREIAGRYGGAFPAAPEDVRALPGIGPYTAGAILSIAYGQRAPILDGNVIRVLSRVFAVADPIDQAAAKRRLWSLAEALVPPPSGVPSSGRNDPGDFNQALMELGATVCVPRGPSCLVCPLAAECQARRDGEQERYPVKGKEREVPMVDVVTLVVRHRGSALLARRPAAGLWGGLWEPPTGPIQVEDGEGPEAAAARLGREGLGLRVRGGALRELVQFDHVLTHKYMRFHPYLLDHRGARAPRVVLGGGYEEARFHDLSGPLALGLSAWVSRLLDRVRGVPDQS
jgi:A/G-specific adenine glycosylase